MADVINEHHQHHGADQLSSEGFLQKFRLYETQSKLYMVGRNKSRTFWKILIIDRSDCSELNIREDSTIYTEKECSDLLRRIHEGNRVTGGLKFITTCYGIVGFVRFLGPYYMLLITRRRQIGTICGHDIYAIAKSDIIAVSDSAFKSSNFNFQKENRYKKLLSMVDLTKDFYFSYSYRVMRCLQKNMCCNEKGLVLYDDIFVWNEYLTHEIRNILQNTLWTVALVYGFFKQATLSISGRNLKLILIARRSRHYAGTRYLKRGVNEEGSVANDVETEQILIEDACEGLPMKLSSVVQIRGSIPLFWSQETSRLNLKPDIILSKRDQTYDATRLHFESLVQRYGNPIIILNLIKTMEKKPRESILRGEFANAIEAINKDLPEESRLKFLHWDLHKHSRSKATNVLIQLGKVAAYALTLTGLFYCHATPEMVSEGHLEHPCLNGDGSIGPPMIQKGVLRTNCIDCLDRTNVAQYAYGLSALGHQLHALGVTTSPKMDLDDPLAEELMGLYERMGDTLAHQYGGSAAHNKIFSERRGQWKAAIQSQEFFRTLQRYYSNAYMDAEKQNAINVFLGLCQPQPGKPDVWELDLHQHRISGRNGQLLMQKDDKSFIKKSLSDVNILHTNSSSTSTTEMMDKGSSGSGFSSESKKGSKMHSESTPDMLSEKVAWSSTTAARDLFTELQREKNVDCENGDTSDCSNFVDLDWLSSGNSCEEELLERSMLTASPITVLSFENVASESAIETTTSSTYEFGQSSKEKDEHPESETPVDEAHDEDKVVEEFSDDFKQWVTHGGTLCY